ncbi:MAG: hypothetical protein P0S95_05085 [Rhabdochlamydiaceae bacterium]|nr:hypothetical protein [Candidatus Amphrikana amoebophyrae]
MSSWPTNNEERSLPLLSEGGSVVDPYVPPVTNNNPTNKKIFKIGLAILAVIGIAALMIATGGTALIAGAAVGGSLLLVALVALGIRTKRKGYLEFGILKDPHKNPRKLEGDQLKQYLRALIKNQDPNRKRDILKLMGDQDQNLCIKCLLELRVEGLLSGKFNSDAYFQTGKYLESYLNRPGALKGFLDSKLKKMNTDEFIALFCTLAEIASFCTLEEKDIPQLFEQAILTNTRLFASFVDYTFANTRMGADLIELSMNNDPVRACLENRLF